MQPPEKVEALVFLLNQDGNVVTPDRVFSEMYTKAGDHFHSCSTDLQGRKLVFVPSKKQTHLLFFLELDAEILHLHHLCSCLTPARSQNHCCC